MSAIPGHPEDAPSRHHLVACPQCQSANGANASACWHCDGPLIRPSPFAAWGAAPDPEPSSEAPAPAHFFPVLREALAADAANDHVAIDTHWPAITVPYEVPPPPVAAPARPRRRGLLAGACGAALLALLGAGIARFSERHVSDPGTTAVATLTPAASRVPAAFLEPLPDAARVPPASPTSTLGLAPAACSRKVDALGLCAPLAP